MDSLAKILEREKSRLQQRASMTTEPPEPEAPVCSLCNGGGLLAKPVEGGQPWEIGYFWCSCRAASPKSDEPHTASMFDYSEIPPRFAGFSFDTYPVAKPTRDPLDAIIAWTRSERPRKPALYLHGPVGTGKTGLAVSAFVELGQRGVWGMFESAPELLDRIRRTYQKADAGEPTESESAVLHKLTDMPLLLLDDLGAERTTDWVIERLFVILNTRYNHLRRTIITSNYTPSELVERLGERIGWRVIDFCHAVALKGSNLRDQGAA